MNWREEWESPDIQSQGNAFTKWLLTQEKRHDPVGHLAHDVALDDEWPTGDVTFIDHLEYIREVSERSQKVEDAFRRAYDEWMEQ